MESRKEETDSEIEKSGEKERSNRRYWEETQLQERVSMIVKEISRETLAKDGKEQSSKRRGDRSLREEWKGGGGQEAKEMSKRYGKQKRSRYTEAWSPESNTVMEKGGQKPYRQKEYKNRNWAIYEEENKQKNEWGKWSQEQEEEGEWEEQRWAKRKERLEQAKMDENEKESEKSTEEEAIRGKRRKIKYKYAGKDQKKIHLEIREGNYTNPRREEETEGGNHHYRNKMQAKSMIGEEEKEEKSWEHKGEIRKQTREKGEHRTEERREYTREEGFEGESVPQEKEMKRRGK